MFTGKADEYDVCFIRFTVKKATIAEWILEILPDRMTNSGNGENRPQDFREVL